MRKIVFVALSYLSISGCTDSDGAKRALIQSGYSDIKITGYNLFSCDEKDFYSTGFKAKGPTGENSEGTVCSGFFKGHTIRFN